MTNELEIIINTLSAEYILPHNIMQLILTTFHKKQNYTELSGNISIAFHY